MQTGNVLLCITVSLSIVAAASVGKQNCGKVTDCANTERLHICGFDGTKACFRRFKSLCYMGYFACEENKIFKIYDESFCYLDNFMCDNEYDEFTKSWSRNEQMDDTILAIYG